MINQLLILFKYSDFSLYYIFVFPSSILEYNLLKIIYDPQFSADYFYAIIIRIIETVIQIIISLLKTSLRLIWNESTNLRNQ